MNENPEMFKCIVFDNIDDPTLVNSPLIVILLYPKQCVKLLGLYIYINLNFHDHFSLLNQKTTQQVNVLAR